MIPIQGRGSFCLFSYDFTAPELHIKPPNQNDRRSELGETVEPKCQEHQTAGFDTGPDRHRGFHGHPGERYMLKPKRLGDQRGSFGHITKSTIPTWPSQSAFISSPAELFPRGTLVAPQENGSRSALALKADYCKKYIKVAFWHFPDMARCPT